MLTHAPVRLGLQYVPFADCAITLLYIFTSRDRFVAGAGGGVCQVVVMGPCTFLVTAAVTGGKQHVGVFSKANEVWQSKGIKGFYPGGTAIAFRQATNWASRQGFTEAVREQFKILLHDGDKTAKLTVAQEAWAGIIGGALSCWNHPFVSSRALLSCVCACLFLILLHV